MSGAVVDDLFPELEGAGLAGSPAPNAPSPIASSSRTPDVMPFGSTSPVEREIPIGPDEDDAGDDVGNLVRGPVLALSYMMIRLTLTSLEMTTKMTNHLHLERIVDYLQQLHPNHPSPKVNVRVDRPIR